MPKGMFLRSACDWHLDATNEHTIENYVASFGKKPGDVEPLSLDFYHSYVEWFQKEKGIEPVAQYVKRLDYDPQTQSFDAYFESQSQITAKRVVIAPGFKYFPNIPDELLSKLPKGRYSHTCDYVDFSDARGKRFLLVGGRQSAFEWAALLSEAGASEVHLSHRHGNDAPCKYRHSGIPQRSRAHLPEEAPHRRGLPADMLPGKMVQVPVLRKSLANQPTSSLCQMQMLAGR